jgi:hypothetical protein
VLSQPGHRVDRESYLSRSARTFTRRTSATRTTTPSTWEVRRTSLAAELDDRSRPPRPSAQPPPLADRSKLLRQHYAARQTPRLACLAHVNPSAHIELHVAIFPSSRSMLTNPHLILSRRSCSCRRLSSDSPPRPELSWAFATTPSLGQHESCGLGGDVATVPIPERGGDRH